MTRIAGFMAEALERGRKSYNARFAAARKGGAAIDGDAFLVHLGNTVAPAIEAVAAEMVERVDGVLNALFDVSLELFAASLLGPRRKSTAVADVWSGLLPGIPRLVMRDPKTVAAALSNAAYNLGRTAGARPADWLAEMRRHGPACETVAELLDLGKVAAWRAGMPHYRAGAIATAKAMRANLVGDLLDIPPDQCEMVLDRMLADPWLTPAVALSDEPAALRLVRTVGAFRGFGGDFLRPPKVSASAGGLFVTDGEATWRIVCDCYGRLLLRHEHVPTPPAPLAVPRPGGNVVIGEDVQIGSDVRIGPDGAVHWGPGRATLPELSAGGVSSFACDGRTLAVTLRTSHHVFLVARAAPAPSAEEVRHAG